MPNDTLPESIRIADATLCKVRSLELEPLLARRTSNEADIRPLFPSKYTTIVHSESPGSQPLYHSDKSAQARLPR